MKTASRLILLSSMVAVGSLTLHEIWNSVYTVDDAFISFRYARNLIEGNGLVFNVGERVEGYTNFLWTIILAGAMALGADPITTSKVLGILTNAGSIYLVYRFSRLTQPTGSPWPLSVLAVTLLAVNGAFATAAITGLETSLFTFLVVAGAYTALETVGRSSGLHAMEAGGCAEDRMREEHNTCHSEAAPESFLSKDGEDGKFPVSPPDPSFPRRELRMTVNEPSSSRLYPTNDASDSKYTGGIRGFPGSAARIIRGSPLLSPVLFALAALTRPEGAVVFGASAVLIALSRNLRREDLITCAKWCVAFACVYLPYFVWRIWYYGDLLPNTYYAKTGAGLAQFYKGLLDLKVFGLTYLGIVFLLALAVLSMRRAPFWVTYITGLLVVFVSLSIYEGGDWIPFFRFLVPALPFYYLLIQEAMRQVHVLLPEKLPGLHLRERRLSLLLVLASVVLVALTAWPSLSLHERLATEVRGQERAHAELARWLKVKAEGPIALMDIGRIGYISGLPLIDTSGLTDRTISHSEGGLIDKKFDLAYVLNRQPEYFVLASTTDFVNRQTGPTDFPIEKRIYEDERFGLYYRYGYTLDSGWEVDGKGYYLMVYERK